MQIVSDKKDVAQAPLLLTPDMFHAGRDFTHKVKLQPEGELVVEVLPVFTEQVCGGTCAWIDFARSLLCVLALF